jgi:hypothetical protein
MMLPADLHVLDVALAIAAPAAGSQLVFAGAAILVLVAACVVVLRAGRDLRGRLTGETGRPVGRAASRGPAPAASLTRDAYAVSRRLKAQGLPTGADSLLSMSPAEQQFFLETVGARIGDGGSPRLVRGRSSGSASASAAAETEAPAEPMPEAALVTGPIHCPVCRAEIGQRSDPGITMRRCPGCARRVGARVDGDRLIVTVSYGLGTPRASGAIKLRS